MTQDEKRQIEALARSGNPLYVPPALYLHLLKCGVDMTHIARQELIPVGDITARIYLTKGR